MKALLGAVALAAVVLAVSACASGHQSSSGPRTSTDTLPLHVSTSGHLPPPLQALLLSMIKSSGPPSGPVRVIEVYGPGSRTALNRAAGGGWVRESAKEVKARFYLIVTYGHFVCNSCSRPPGAASPHGNVWAEVWSPTVATGDDALMQRLPAAVHKLHRLARLTMS